MKYCYLIVKVPTRNSKSSHKWVDLFRFVPHVLCAFLIAFHLYLTPEKWEKRITKEIIHTFLCIQLNYSRNLPPFIGVFFQKSYFSNFIILIYFYLFFQYILVFNVSYCIWYFITMILFNVPWTNYMQIHFHVGKNLIAIIRLVYMEWSKLASLYR